jgi:hypothetical protein
MLATAPGDGSSPNAGLRDANLATEGTEGMTEADAQKDTVSPYGNDGPGTHAHHRGRAICAVMLMVLGTVLTPITILALFVHTEVTDTSRYVQNVAPLASDPAIQAYFADDITNRLFARVDVAGYVKDALPARAQRLAGPLQSALRGFVHEATLRVLQSTQFQQLWKEANRVAHLQIVNVLTGRDGDIVSTTNGVVYVDVSQIVKRVITRLQATGIDLFSRIPIVQVGGKIPVFQSKDLPRARRAFDVLDKLALVLPFAVFASFGGAILLSRNHRRGFLIAAVCFTIGGLLLAIALAVARSAYLNAATGHELPYDAAAAVYDTLVRFLHTSVRAVLMFSIAVVVAVFFAGPSRLATGFRSRARDTASRLGQQADDAGWGWLGSVPVVAHHKGAWRAATAAIAFVVLFRWNHPTPVVILWAAVITVAALALIEYFGREPMPATVDVAARERAQQQVGPPSVTSAS